MIKLLLLLILACVSLCHAQTVPPQSVTYEFTSPSWLVVGNNSDRMFRSCMRVNTKGFLSAQAARDAFTARVIECFVNSHPNTQQQYKEVIGVTFITTQTQGAQTLTLTTCLLPVHYSGCNFQNNSIDSVTYATSSTLTMQITAFPVCPSGFSNPKLTNDVWTCSPASCPSSGTAATLGRLTTISSITETGWIVPAGSMPNPQCKNKCRVQHPGGSLQCTGYYPINGLVVGGPVYSSCSADVTHTGTPCNYGGAGGIETLPEWSDRPATFTQTEGNDDGGDGGSDSEILSAIRENTEKAASTLSKIASNQAVSEDNAEYQNNLLLYKLDELLGKLTSIDNKTGGSGGGNNSGGDGTGKTTGGESVGEINVDIDAPAAGLKSPGETNAGFQKLLAGTGINRSAGSCPTWTFEIKFLSVSPVLDTHCALWAKNAAVFESLMMALWTLGALFLVLSA